jgi:mono/diheme cytochrome c family protein
MPAGGTLSIGTVAAFVLAGAIARVVLAQPAGQPRTVWDGVYTGAQADRGKRAYESSCAHCHGQDLGGLDGPPLVGPDFLRNWTEDSLGSLLSHISSKMPADAPGTLPRTVSLEILAYLLSANGFPEGKLDLDDGLDPSRIVLTGKDGPAPLPTSTLVLVLGCFALTSPGEWLLAQGTEPVRTRDMRPESDAALSALAARPPGALVVGLLDIVQFQPQRFAGQRVALKGLLIRRQKTIAVNVMSVQPVGTTCTSQ